MKRLIKVLLVAGLFVMGIMMAVFALAGLQTVEWCMNDGIPVPWQAWAMLATVAVWCVIAVNIPEKVLKDIDLFFTKLTEE